MQGLEGQVALVTGAAAGIGRATALMMAHQGARVVISDLAVESGNAVVEEINADGGEAVFVPADVSKGSEVETLVRTAVEKYGRLDCAVNNAGINGSIKFTADYDEAEWQRVIDINLKGVWLCMKHEIPRMLEQGKGAIVNLSSMGGLVGFPAQSPYIASKHGVIGLTRTAALEYGGNGIRVNAVCPGVIHTTMVESLLVEIPDIIDGLNRQAPIGRIGQPGEIAAAIVWLCSDAASFVTGHALSVDGGYVIQ